MGGTTLKYVAKAGATAIDSLGCPANSITWGCANIEINTAGTGYLCYCTGGYPINFFTDATQLLQKGCVSTANRVIGCPAYTYNAVVASVVCRGCAAGATQVTVYTN